MSRYARKLITSGDIGWDAEINDNLANVFDRPIPVHIEDGPLADLETAFPAASNDQGLAICDYDGSPANGKMFAVSDGAAWHHASGWQMFNRLTPVGKTSAFTTTAAENYYVMTGSGTYNATLEAISAANKGRRILFKFNGTGTVTLVTTGSDTIDGASTKVVAGGVNHAYELISDGTGDWQVLKYTDENQAQIIPLIVAVGDEDSVLETGTAKVTFRVPAAFTITGVRASLTTASSTGTVTVDINEGGVSILSTEITIDATEKTSTTAAVPAVVSDASLADDAEITIDVDAAGTSADATGLKVTILGTM